MDLGMPSRPTASGPIVGMIDDYQERRRTGFIVHGDRRWFISDADGLSGTSSIGAHVRGNIDDAER